jgi:hypothetical protein
MVSRPALKFCYCHPGHDCIVVIFVEFTHACKLIGVIWFITLCSATKRKRGGPGGLNKLCAISHELQAVIGETAMSSPDTLVSSLAKIRK